MYYTSKFVHFHEYLILKIEINKQGDHYQVSNTRYYCNKKKYSGWIRSFCIPKKPSYNQHSPCTTTFIDLHSIRIKISSRSPYRNQSFKNDPSEYNITKSLRQFYILLLRQYDDDSPWKIKEESLTFLNSPTNLYFSFF